MDNVTLKLIRRQANGDPLAAVGGVVPTVAVGMRFLNDLPPKKSLYRFKFDLEDGGSPFRFDITSDDAGDLFRYYEDVYYGDPAAPSLVFDTADQNGAANGTVTVALSAKASQDETFTITNFSFALSGGGGSVAFALTNTDNSTYYLFYDTILESHLPNSSL